MPKRGAIATVLTGFALVLLINFKTPSQTGAVGAGTLPGLTQPQAVAASPAAPGASTAPASPNGGGATSGPGGSSGSGSSGSGGSSASGPGGSSGSGSSGSSGSSASGPGGSSAGSSGSSGSSSSASSSPSTKTAAYSGQQTSPVVETPYGPVQLQVTFSNGKIVDVKALQLPTSHFQSQMISNYVAPVLRQQALQAQSAQINGVSGATFTSIGYAQSLQAAIDQAHA